MHPIERLRAVARAREVDQRHLAHEAALVLSVMGTDDRALVTACRRLIDRHPAAGALWWTCAQLIEDRDTRSAGRRAAEVFAESIAADPVLEALALDIPVGAAVVVAPDPAGGSELAGDLRARRQDLVVVEEPDLDDPLAVAEMFPHDAAPAEGDAARPRLLVVEAAATGGDVALVLGGARAAIAGARDRGAAVWLVAGPGRLLPTGLFDVVVARNPQAEVVEREAVDRWVEPRAEPCPCPPELLRPSRGW